MMLSQQTNRLPDMSYLIQVVIAGVAALMGIPHDVSGQKSSGQALPLVEFHELRSEKRVDVTIGGKLFTAYAWPDTVMKPILYPVLTAAGTELTRGFP